MTNTFGHDKIRELPYLVFSFHTYLALLNSNIWTSFWPYPPSSAIVIWSNIICEQPLTPLRYFGSSSHSLPNIVGPVKKYLKTIRLLLHNKLSGSCVRIWKCQWVSCLLTGEGATDATASKMTRIACLYQNIIKPSWFLIQKLNIQLPIGQLY